MAPAGAARAPSKLIATARPETEKIPALNGPTGTAWDVDATPLFTTMFTVPLDGTSHGSCALICPADTNSSGAAIPLTLTVTPASDLGSGITAADSVRVARFTP